MAGHADMQVYPSLKEELGLLARVFMTQNCFLADKTGAQFWAVLGGHGPLQTPLRAAQD